VCPRGRCVLRMAAVACSTCSSTGGLAALCILVADSVAQDLLRLVLAHQMHVCRDFLCRKKDKHKCSKHFPFPEQYERAPKQNGLLGMWTYFRPGPDHRNVIPYHGEILLSWRAHMNLQIVTHSEWSRYLLK
jgi:hypothetical protein